MAQGRLWIIPVTKVRSRYRPPAGAVLLEEKRNEKVIGLERIESSTFSAHYFSGSCGDITYKSGLTTP